jgi:DNA polymerase-1
MPAAGFDTETHLIEPGLLAPPLVCLSSAVASDLPWMLEDGPVARVDRRLFHANPNKMPRGHGGPPIDHRTAKEHFVWLLQQDPLYGLNVAYDMCVCLSQWPDLAAAIFAAYDDGRVIDVGLCQRLIDNATGSVKSFEARGGGGYSLAALERRHFGEDREQQKKGPDAWRLRYKELRDVPLTMWPEDAASYPLDDASGPLRIGQYQLKNHAELLKDAPAQARAAFALQLLMCWGVMTDGAKIERLEKFSQQLYPKLSAELVARELVRPADALKKPGTRDTKAAKRRIVLWCRMYELPIQLTDAGDEEIKRLRKERGDAKLSAEDLFTKEDFEKYASVDEDACNETGDPVMVAYSRRTQLHNILYTHVPDLLKGVKKPIQPKYSTMVDSGRTSCSKGKGGSTNGFQFQNPKRALNWEDENKKQIWPAGVGIRECFVARPGRLFADPDFGGLELCTGAQACIATVGYSKLGDAINAGLDPHLQFGAKLMGISYEEAKARKHEKVVKFHRQLSKCANFGLPGGLGVKGLIGFSHGYGVRLSYSEAEKLRDDWFLSYDEWVQYFKFIRKHIDVTTNRGQIAQLFVGRIRGDCTFPSLCNTLWQGLGADGAKHALYEVSKRCYVPELKSVLYGARPVGFIHDEILAEVFEELAHEQTLEMCRVMEQACNEFLPDVPVKAVPALCKRWGKDNEAVYDKSGRLQPYDLARDGKWEVYYDAGANERVTWKEAA